MTASINNLRSGGRRRNAIVLSVTTMTILAMVGVVSFPVRNLAAVKSRHATAMESVARARKARASAERFAAVQGFERIRSASNAVDSTLPSDLSAVDLHGTLRLLCGASSIELHNLSVGPFSPTTLPVFEDSVARCEVVFDGSAELQSLAVLLGALGELGYPAALLDFQISRTETSDSRFEVRATIGIHQSAPPPVEPELTDFQSSQEGP